MIALLVTLADSTIIPGTEWSAPRSFFFCAPQDARDGFWSLEFASSAEDQYLSLSGNGPKYAPQGQLDVTLERPFKRIVYTKPDGGKKWVVEAEGLSGGVPVDLTLTLARAAGSDSPTAAFVVRTKGQTYSVDYCRPAPLPPSRRTAKASK